MSELSYRLEYVGDTAVLCDVPPRGRRPATLAEVELFAQVERFRTVLNDLLLTRQAHQEADEEEMRLACAMHHFENDEFLVEAHDRTGETALVHEAAWDRARSLLAGEAKP